MSDETKRKRKKVEVKSGGVKEQAPIVKTEGNSVGKTKLKEEKKGVKK